LARSSGFTLIELLVVIGVLLILMGLLLPMATKAWKTSQINAMKFDFHTIGIALENYKSDFRDYPRNGFATADFYNTTNNPNYSANQYLDAPPRIDPSLVMGLLGPGAANAILAIPGGAGYSNVTAMNSNGYINADMDGADGMGFKSLMSPYASTTLQTAAAAGTTRIAVVSTFASPINNTTVNGLAPAPFTVISLGGPGSPDVHVPIRSTTSSVINLAVPLQNSYAVGTPVGLLLPSGKTWGPYLKVDQFKVVYVVSNIAAAGSNTTAYAALPVLEDIWGGPILYFPSYNSYANQALTHPTSLLGAMPTVGTLGYTPPTPLGTPPATVGPLMGLPGISAAYNTPVPIPAGSAFTGPSIFWDGPLGFFGGGNASASYTALSPVPFTPGQVAAILVKLGDNNANNVIDSNASANPPYTESFNVQLPYFLMSAGPDGTFQDLSANGQGDWNRIMSKSDDVYDFGQ
jgi:prepilin-type N-terminal cleavage/methylation domain-containing protein